MYSNTTFVKVKFISHMKHYKIYVYSNTTFVKVKLKLFIEKGFYYVIQIQHLLKLNTDSGIITKAEARFKYNIC